MFQQYAYRCFCIYTVVIVQFTKCSLLLQCF